MVYYSLSIITITLYHTLPFIYAPVINLAAIYPRCIRIYISVGVCVCMRRRLYTLAVCAPYMRVCGVCVRTRMCMCACSCVLESLLSCIHARSHLLMYTCVYTSVS